MSEPREAAQHKTPQAQPTAAADGAPDEIGAQRIAPQGLLEKRRTAQTAYVFDLRTPEAFDESHLPGAFNLPAEHVEANLHRLPFQGDLLFYDGGDGAARRVAALLRENAFTDFFYMEEGYATLHQALLDSPQDVKYGALTPAERATHIERVLDEKVREYLASDGGGLEVVAIEDDSVTVSYQGACGSCGSSTAGTLRFIQMALTNGLNHEIEVLPVDA
ncbi:MAG: NifU family protein [Candidatus Lambdaproteobacteria bacterium]|nr:NifU family protein [Candidatus Lambdaproteobacteria bacterium]